MSSDNPSRNRSNWYKCDDCDEWFFGPNEYGGHRSNCRHRSDTIPSSDTKRFDGIVDKYFGDE